MTSLSILIVEDEAIVAQDLAGKVRQLGYQVAGITATGEEAVEIARGVRPCLVLMDIRLAGAIDGIEAARVIHRECKLPVVFLTAHSDIGTVERASQAEAAGYILKPFDERDLRIQVEMAIYKHAAERRLRESEERLAGINRILNAALACATEQELGLACLQVAESITGSTLGFIGDIDNAGLEEIAISNPGWEACNILASEGHRIPGTFKIHGIYGRVIKEGRGLFTNDPALHPDSIGLPEGHPPLTSFLGVPLLSEGRVVGILAVGNGAEGYTRTDQDALEALAPSIVEAFRRKKAEEELRKSSAELQAANIKLLDSRRATLNMMQDAIIAQRKSEEMSLELQREVADRKRAEQRLIKLNEELETRVEERTSALRDQDQLLLLQSRQAAMGEMIGNIAHQWRQPLNTLGLSIQQLALYYELGEFSKELLDQNVDKSMEIIEHMSNTIDDFRNYFKPDKEKVEFSLSRAVRATLSLIKDSFSARYISIEMDQVDDPEIYGFQNEFAQVLLNILNNAGDALTEREIDNPKVKITMGSEGDRAVVTVADNAGGIPEEIMDKIFEPYFTTKGPQQGTGIGLFMAKTIIEKNMGGSLTVRNIAGGAEFRIET
jgi:signal transduction histidine kinase/AmiR/NasT family two-component response regulator